MNPSDTTHLKIPPHSAEAEQSVLGGLMLNNESWDQVSDVINETDFYTSVHKIIFNALKTLLENNEAVDILILSEHLKEYKLDEKSGGFDYLAAITDATPSIANIGAYAKHIRELSVLRRLLTTTNEIATMAYHPEGRGANELLDIAEGKVFEIAEHASRGGKDVISVKDALPGVISRVYQMQEQEGITGLETGFEKLDELTSGLQKSDLIIVAGRPSMGKTAFAMNIVEHVAVRKQKPVAVFSLEMSTEQLRRRMISSFGHINATKIRNGSLNDIDWASFNNAVKCLGESHVLIDETPSISPTEVRAKCRRLKRQHPDLAMVVIDYLQLMSVQGGKSENRVQEISEISRSLKALAKELNVPVVALSQLNRGVEGRPKAKKGRMPQMADLRESGAIEQDADIIAFIYRDEAYHADDYQNPHERGRADLKIAKHRNGAIGHISLAFVADYARFETLATSSQFDNEPHDGVYKKDLSNFSDDLDTTPISGDGVYHRDLSDDEEF